MLLICIGGSIAAIPICVLAIFLSDVIYVLTIFLSDINHDGWYDKDNY